MQPATADAAATVQLRNNTPIPAIHAPAPPDDHLKTWLLSEFVLLSDNRPEMSIRTPILKAVQPSLVPSKFDEDELLDWDAAIEVAPARPSGTLTVTLEYAGRATPSPTRDPWD
jgi:hypothetical protein